MKETIKQLLSDSISVKQTILSDQDLLAEVEKIAQLCGDALRNNSKILFAGNGGSASDAQHLAAELVGRFEKERRGLPGLAFTTNTSSITAIGNDYGYEAIFSRQMEAMGQSGDVFIGFSTSGNSINVIKAIQEAKSIGIHTVGMTGASGGKMRELCDLCVCVPSDNTARIQESHITLGHIICALIENDLF